MRLNLIARGDGPPVALLHGLFGQAPNFGTLQRRLAGRHRVLALDLRGHGQSPHGPLDYPAMAADVFETLAAHDALPCAILGHSMGGKVAMTAALAEPASVIRLVVADIAPVSYPPHFRAHAAAMLALPLHPGTTRAEVEAGLAAVEPDPRVRGFLAQNFRPQDVGSGANPSWRIGLADIAASLPAIEGWASPVGRQYGGPTLVVAGERSTYIAPDARPLFRALFPKCRFATLKGAGHWVHADAPAAFAELVGAFLAV